MAEREGWATIWHGNDMADRLAGQASIFDLGDGPSEAAAPRHHPALSPEEFEKSDLLRMEKETLGLYVSEHPLNELRDDMRRKTDASLAELDRRRAAASRMGGPDKLASRKKRGQLNAQERLDALIDKDSFIELGLLGASVFDADADATPRDGKITGFVSSTEPGVYEYLNKGEVIRCPWHGWEFDIKTGKSWCDPKKVHARAHACACVRACVRARTRACARACTFLRACVRARACVRVRP